MKRRTLYTVLPACFIAVALVAYLVGKKLAPPGDGVMTKLYTEGQLSFEHPATWFIFEESNEPYFQQVMLRSPAFDYCIIRRIPSEDDSPAPTLDEFAREFLNRPWQLRRSLFAARL